MKHKKKRFCIGISLLCLLTAVVLLLPASANSAQTWFEGQDSTGAFMPEGSESPIVVEGERLIFDIPHFPVLHGNVQDNAEYAARVTAEYTFYNPSDYTVTSRLLFPFGQKPYYMDDAFDPETGEHVPFDDTAAYAITLDGETVERRVRHTLGDGWSFDLATAMTYFSDHFYTDGFFSPDLTVTKYVYRTSGVEKKENPSATVAFEIPPRGGFGEERRVWFPQMHIYQTHFRKAYAGTWVDFSSENEITLYVLGAPLAEPIEWTFYEDGGLDPFEKIDGTVTLLRTETMRFSELALADWYAESGVSEVDWYNAVIASLMEQGASGGVLRADRYAPGNDLTSRLMRWYEYEITFAPGERRINTVTAPIYPAVDMDWEPDVYEYTYLLSPAATWVDFGRIEIVINTPYYIVNDEHNAFEPTEQGYQKMLPGLPEGELTFSLSTEENPTIKDGSGWYILLLILGVGYAFLVTYGVLSWIGFSIWNLIRLGIVALIVLILRKREKRRRAKENEQSSRRD